MAMRISMKLAVPSLGMFADFETAELRKSCWYFGNRSGSGFVFRCRNCEVDIGFIYRGVRSRCPVMSKPRGGHVLGT